MSKRKPTRTNAHGLRIPRQGRALVNPIEHAIAGAVKPQNTQIKQITAVLQQAAKQMREGVATAGDWGIVAGSLSLAIAIERGGIVRGLGGHFEAFERVMQTIQNRAMLTGRWQRTALWHYELDELRHFIDLHTYQLKQLSRSELETALTRATATIKSEGCTVEIVRDVQAFGQERMAA